MHHAIAIFHAAIAAVQPQRIIPQYIQWRNGLFINNKPVPLKGRLFLAAAGKAAAAMALETERVIGPHLTAGLAITKHEHGLPLQYCRLIEAGHPLPDEHSVEAAEALQSMLQNLQQEDVVICLLSGGASALVTDLPDNMDLHQLRDISDQLIKSGADIQEINTIRKHLSRIKGGGLAHIVYPARLYVIVLSDVVGDRLDVIASGPAAPDTSTLADAQHIAQQYGLLQLPLHETPKPGDPIFTNVEHLLAGSNDLALQAAQQKRKPWAIMPISSPPRLPEVQKR
ncbi:glycerate-2-kinase family protein [Chitinophaga sedimenti]|uniref:glycerate kinase type-2 family protein n=1 Tax=Chitinophaga sedimenti TaxID=2033606 RepID=UPI0020068B43|nr:glycerate-2-kinase family protein [Chitinophaga sedimenti]MCK7557425.1 glycerate-2-kinase family protein [Chitinophaga sedimenti]